MSHFANDCPWNFTIDYPYHYFRWLRATPRASPRYCKSSTSNDARIQWNHGCLCKNIQKWIGELPYFPSLPHKIVSKKWIIKNGFWPKFQLVGFYKGMFAPFISVGMLNSLLFSGYGLTLKYLHPNEPNVEHRKGLPMYEILGASVVGTLFQMGPAIPVELVKTKLQVSLGSDTSKLLKLWQSVKCHGIQCRTLPRLSSKAFLYFCCFIYSTETKVIGSSNSR